MDKINIGYFIDTFYPMIDGVITVVDNYARCLSKYANVTVFAPSIDNDFDDTKLPYKVVINEVVELSKKYGDDNSKSFVNGVLARIISDSDKGGLNGET